jgi:uncharacterized protein YdbL (DUF1318 family)
MVRRLFLTLFLLAPLAAWAALTLDDAKQSGLVGEDASGYIAAVSNKPSRDVLALVADINGKRRTEYERIAAANGISVTDVEQLAGKKAIEKSPAGDYIRLPGEDWRKK